MDEDDAVDGVEEDVPGEAALPPPHGHPGHLAFLCLLLPPTSQSSTAKGRCCCVPSMYSCSFTRARVHHR